MQPAALRSTLIDALLPAAGLPAWARNALLAVAGSLWAVGVEPFYLATVFKTLLAAASIKAGWSAANLRG